MALGQQTSNSASITGIVLDPQGSAIAGARLTVVPVSRHAVTRLTTGADGRFKVDGIPPGRYTLSLTASGFESLSQTVSITAGPPQDERYTLRIAAAKTTVVVTATRSARSVADVPASVSVIGSERIEQAPARTIDDVLRRVPSVDLPLASTNEQHPTDTIVSMRGLSGIRSLILLDGVPLNDPFFGFVQWSEVPLETVDQVEVVRGGGSTLWGNYAMGGVVNILTRPENKRELVVESAGGSRNTWRTDGHAAYAASRYGIGIDAGTSHSGGYIEQANGLRGSIDVPTSFTSDTLALSADGDLAGNLNARGRISHYSNAMNYLTHLQTNGEGTWRYTGALVWQPGSGNTLHLNALHNDERFSTNNTGAPSGADPNHVEYIQNVHRTLVGDTGLSLLWTKSLGSMVHSFSAGGDYHGIRGSDTAAIYGEDAVYLRTDTGSGNQRFTGGFVQADLRPLERLQVLASLRYQNFYSYNGRDDTPGGLGNAVPTRSNDALDPRISARYQLPRGFALRAAFYRAFRAPTLDNLYRSASVPGYILYSNASLAPETLNGGEFGVDYDKGSLRLQVTAYDSHIANLLTYRYLDPATLPTGFTTGARLINAASAYSRGFEGELDWHLRPELGGVLGYTYADSVVTSNPEDPASIGVQQPGIPKNKATLGIDWLPWRTLTVSPRLRYLSRTTGDPDNIYHTDPHFIADLAVTVPLRRNLQAFVQVENLLNRTYIGTNDGFTAPLLGRPFTAVAGLRLKLH